MTAYVQKFIDIALIDIQRANEADGQGRPLTYAEVAKQLGISAQVLSQARTGSSPASLDRLVTWCGLWGAGQWQGGIGVFPRSQIRLLIQGGEIRTLEAIPAQLADVGGSAEEAIRLYASYGWRIDKYSDPIEEAREGLTVEEALAVAREDRSLIFFCPPG